MLLHAKKTLLAATCLLLAAPAVRSQGIPQWVLHATNSPPARNSSPAAYDVYRGVTTLFGGYVGTSTPLGDTWEYNGTTWVPRVTPVRPSPRWGHNMAFDTRRGRVVLFGGYDGSSIRSDTWEWDGVAWNQRLLASPPPARGYFGMTYDGARGVVVIVGGQANASVLGDTWEYDGNAWIQRSVPVAPSARRGMACVWDETRRETLLFGGTDGTQVFNDLWAWNGGAWSQRSAVGPAARQAGCLAADGNCGRVVLHGGADATFSTNYGDSWAWDGLQWALVTGPLPPGRHGAAMVHDTQRGQFVLWGGRDAAGFRSDTWELGAGCARTMTTVAGPISGQTAQFRYDYPAQPGGLLFCWTLITPRLVGGFAVPIPGMPSIGLCRVDLGNLLLQPATFLNASGSLMTAVAIPASPVINGLQFDVQSVDLDLFTLTLRWAENDVESTVAPAAPNASFTATPSTGASPLTVVFTNTSTSGSTYLWDFGDGTSSTLQSPPAKVYVGGTYTAALTVTGPSGTDSASTVITVTGPSNPPVANFTAAPTWGPAPLTVHFTDTSTQQPSAWQWDFDNDGIIDSTQQNPIWTYQALGSQSVRLVATNALGASSLTRASLIVVGVPNPALNMVPVPAGSFSMGSSASANQQPVHNVTISRSFWMGRFEVTQSEYQSIMGNNPAYYQGVNWPNSGSRPVEKVTWQNAVDYCHILTTLESSSGRVPAGYQYRLPTEAEWEYCCRAGTTTPWSTGSSLSCAQANHNPGTWCVPTGMLLPGGQTTTVGSYAANAFGMMDMHGNVSEWCLDAWDLSANYPAGAVTDPFVSTGPYRVLRGGSWNDGVTPCASSFRFAYPPNNEFFATSGHGFRIVLAPVIP